MVDPIFPDGDRALLTDALDDPGTDLRDLHTVFADHLAAVVPSFLGVTVTLTLDGVEVTLSDHDFALTATASLTLPFSALVQDVLGCTMMIYAEEAGAFKELAAAVTSSDHLRAIRGRGAGAGEHTCTRRNVAPPLSGHSLAVSGPAEFSSPNRLSECSSTRAIPKIGGHMEFPDPSVVNEGQVVGSRFRAKGSGFRAVQGDTAITCVDWQAFHSWQEDDQAFTGVITVVDDHGGKQTMADWSCPTDAAADISLGNTGWQRVGPWNSDHDGRRSAPVCRPPDGRGARWPSMTADNGAT